MDVTYIIYIYSTCYDHSLSGPHSLKCRIQHSPVVIRATLYSWGGQVNFTAPIHDKPDARKPTSYIDAFHLHTFNWEMKNTTGVPPQGLRYYACTTMENSILYFAGTCKPNDCYHNDLVELNTISHNWREIPCITPDSAPMRKVGCGMISFHIGGEECLLVFGGYGPTPVTTHAHSQYVSSPNFLTHCYTNEAQIMNITSSPGNKYSSLDQPRNEEGVWPTYITITMHNFVTDFQTSVSPCGS